MKTFLKKILPASFLHWYRQQKIKKQAAWFAQMSPHEVFTEIYTRKFWGNAETVSGTGSTLSQTQTLVKELDSLLKHFQIQSVLDIPCGDFNWMQQVDLTGIRYTGADIVKELIDNNIQKYQNTEHRKFEVLDLLTSPLPAHDLVLVRDCLVHFSIENIHKALGNIKKSGSKYLLATTFTQKTINPDIVTGHWRAVNLQIEPFCLPAPLLVINEGIPTGEQEFKDKSMALWEIDRI